MNSVIYIQAGGTRQFSIRSEVSEIKKYIELGAEKTLTAKYEVTKIDSGGK